ncbi:MAG: HAD-IIB family hydrolase [Eubacterium sp.]|nr:HAD-IIB family hydrolase [Eubacterium sp.]
MVKLIVSDVDGTLVEDGTFEINPEYFEVIEKLRAKGILFVAASGRQFASIASLFGPVKDKIAFISEGGACIWKDSLPYVPRPVPYEYIRDIALDIKEIPGADFMIGTPGYSLCPTEGTEMYRWLRDGYRFKIRSLGTWDIPAGFTFTKASLYYPERVEEVATESGYMEKWGDKLHLSMAGNMWLDGVMPGVNKASALEVIRKDLGISPDETWAFGDNQNDLEMMVSSGRSFAVSTAREEVREKASDVLGGNYSDDSVLGKIKELL